MIKKQIFNLIKTLELNFKQITAPKIAVNKNIGQEKVSVIIIVYNSLAFVKTCLNSIKNTNYKSYEIIVVNNNSNTQTTEYLIKQQKAGIIKKLINLKENVYFCKGNNIGAKLASKNSYYLLFLNSDIKVLNKNWLEVLTFLSPKIGIISFGFASLPFRPDGWCYLINKSLFFKLKGINEKFTMNWGITDLTKKTLSKNYKVRVVINFDKYIKHFGSKSYNTQTNPFMDKNKPNILKLILSVNWFKVQAKNLTLN